MPKAWTGRLVGKMHTHKVSYEDVAAELGVTKSYVSMILNSKREPDGAKERLESAVNSIIQKRRGSQYEQEKE